MFSLIKKLFGTKNARELKKLQPLVEKINGLAPRYKAMSDAEVQGMTGEFRRRLDQGSPLDELLPEAFAVTREARSFDGPSGAHTGSDTTDPTKFAASALDVWRTPARMILGFILVLP